MTTTFRSKTSQYRSAYANMKKLGYEFLIDATGTKRRVEALMCMGYSTTEIGKRIGVFQQGMSDLLHKRTHVYRDTARKIAAVYDELHLIPNNAPYAGRTRALARERGYAAPACWEPGTIDDPTAIPEGVLK